MIQVIKQLDGGLAVYSDAVNRWLRWDLSPAEAAEWLASHGEYLRPEADLVVEAVFGDRADAVYRQYALTFAEANAHSANGAEVFASLGDEDLRRALDGADG